MPNLLGRSKHEEFESNSALQIRDQKERRAENAKKLELQEIWQAAKFSQPAKIRGLRNFATCEFLQVALFIMRNFLPVVLFMSPTLSTILLFDVLTHLVPFSVFFQICPL